MIGRKKDPGPPSNVMRQVELADIQNAWEVSRSGMDPAYVSALIEARRDGIPLRLPIDPNAWFRGGW